MSGHCLWEGSLLQAKEICEEEGFEILHAITDSLWIRKKDSERRDSDLCGKSARPPGSR